MNSSVSSGGLSELIRRYTASAFAKMNAKAALAVLVLVEVLLIDYAFVDVIGNNPGFRRAGFEPFPPLPWSQLAAALVAMIPLSWLRIRFRAVSDILVLNCYFFVFVPSTILLSTTIPATFERQMVVLAILVLAMALVEVRRLPPLLHIASQPISHALFTAILFAVGTAAALYMAYRGELSFDNLDLSTVYERRADLIAMRGGTLLGYVANWSALALSPALLVYGTARRNWPLVLLGLALAVEGFAATSFRSHLFLPLLTLGVAFLIRYNGPRSIATSLAAVAIGLSLFPILIDLVTGNGGLLTYMIQFRFLGNNGFLTAQYFSYFEFAPYGLYQDTFGRLFFKPVYNRALAELVGSSFAMEGNHANGNLWADGYANLGVYGVIFASASLALVAWLLDSLTENKPIEMAVAAAFIIGFGVANTAVHATLTSNGGLLFLLLMVILPNAKGPEVPAER